MRRKVRWLAYAAFLTALATTVTYSRYMTTLSGSQTATVANISLSGQFSETITELSLVGLAPGDTKSYEFKVVNYVTEGDKVRVSDVSQNYSIILEFTDNLPVTYTLVAKNASSVQGNMAEPWTENSDQSKGQLITSKDGRLPHTVKTEHEYTLIVTWPSTENQPRYSYEVDAVSLHVISQQAGE